jgi:site-specific DNA recombinase
MVRAVGYIRVSTDKQEEHGLSVEAQQAKLTAYAQLYELAVVAVEVEGASAKSLDRPGLQRALDHLTGGRADALLVVKLDRVTRSVRDLGTLIEGYFSRRWSLLSVGEHIDTRTAAGRMVLHILASVSQWEREAIGERTAEVLHYKQRRHEYVGGEPPYGWQVAADGVHVEPHRAEQAIIQVAQSLHRAGGSLRQIGRQLQARGHAPRRGRRWHAETVKALVQAEGADGHAATAGA